MVKVGDSHLFYGCNARAIRDFISSCYKDQPNIKNVSTTLHDMPENNVLELAVYFHSKGYPCSRKFKIQHNQRVTYSSSGVIVHDPEKTFVKRDKSGKVTVADKCDMVSESSSIKPTLETLVYYTNYSEVIEFISGTYFNDTFIDSNKVSRNVSDTIMIQKSIFCIAKGSVILKKVHKYRSEIFVFEAENYLDFHKFMRTLFTEGNTPVCES
jgi:hypothetical protein